MLRRLSIDELPQLWNVVRGDMSVIGPRPTLRYQVERYDERQRRRLEVKPGITGWAQIHGRASLPWEDRIELDVWYVEHRSPKVDLEILARTPLALFSGTYKGDDRRLESERLDRSPAAGPAAPDGLPSAPVTAVLFTCAGQRVDIVSAFRRAGARTVAVDANPLAPALYHAHEHAIVPRVDDPGYLPALQGLVREHEVAPRRSR